MKKTAITYGTFDMFHIGHLRLLQRLRSMSDELIVGVSTEHFNDIKKKKALIPFEQRVEIIASIEHVDKVIPEENWDQKIIDIQKYNVNLFGMGNDWKGKFDYLVEYCEVVYLERTENVSTTALKMSLDRLLSVPRDDIIRAFDILELLQKDLE